jgi:hypothetical protein
MHVVAMPRKNCGTLTAGESGQCHGAPQERLELLLLTVLSCLQ